MAASLALPPPPLPCRIERGRRFFSGIGTFPHGRLDARTLLRDEDGPLGGASEARLPTLTAALTVPRPRDEVFPFFAAAENLARLTPPELGFSIVTPTPIAMREGLEISYRISLFGAPFGWTSLITVWRPPELFVDEQLRGPYALWRHEHRFTERDGATLVEDHVTYALPFEPLGALALPLVRAQLRRIFEYRQKAISAHFAGAGMSLPSSVSV